LKKRALGGQRRRSSEGPENFGTPELEGKRGKRGLLEKNLYEKEAAVA